MPASDEGDYLFTLGGCGGKGGAEEEVGDAVIEQTCTTLNTYIYIYPTCRDLLHILSYPSSIQIIGEILYPLQHTFKCIKLLFLCGNYIFDN